ncbi:hypothetical protein GNI_135200 [Gregarina niphandrodes]|uniref:Uncharacterized protein n=1 Tax=Gregarina niphandrodes TaxID=110365 RepID=A0A023B135_GRENI|nr:hypothetical protein GNI_135200 [Gregarina niphandrodes]EZG46122.1 hypothetical protein GNI_135200 [Gregarina niphandrodes]|eukprot:XP_011132378.1 hypothetical protein GNI_135200 [Gregarina niphandrodes]
MKAICSAEPNCGRLVATLVAGIVDAQGNFMDTSGCSFMTVNVSMTMRPKKLNPHSVHSQPEDLKFEDFKVVVSVPKGCSTLDIPCGVSSLQLSAKSRKNQRKSAASLYQFVRALAHKVLTTQSDEPSAHFGGYEAACELKGEIMKRMAGDFYPKINEYEQSLSCKERDEVGALLRRWYCHGSRDIEESQLESHLTFPPNSKEAKERDIARSYFQIDGEPEGGYDNHGYEPEEDENP